ncbi:MAG: HAD-IIB family hydrolase [Nitrososphaeraceae archaeon]
MCTMEKVIFTDIDGTLLDSHLPDIKKMKKLVAKTLESGAHLILCSSKTEPEQNKIKSNMDLHEPYIVENGGATIVPMDYFKKSKITSSKIFQKNYIIETGGTAQRINSILKKIKNKHDIDFKAVSDLSISELSKITKLPRDYASRMMKRKYSETIVQIDHNNFPKFASIVEKEGLKIIPGGQYFDITLGNDKGTAVKVLIDIFRKEYSNNVIFFGIGDSKNDESMLTLMDFPMLVQKPNRSWESLQMNDLQKINGIGPTGWEIALDLVLKY